MSLKLYEEQSVQEIADAIRAKNGSSNTYKIGEMATAVSEIQAGSGSTVTDISLGLTSATVGQIAKIAAVDASGKPTAWSPVDIPSAGSETWEPIRDFTLTEDVAQVTINLDENGKPFRLKKRMFLSPPLPQQTKVLPIPRISVSAQTRYPRVRGGRTEYTLGQAQRSASQRDMRWLYGTHMEASSCRSRSKHLMETLLRTD